MAGKRVVFGLLLAVWLASGGTAHAASDGSPVDCSQAATTLDMRMCLSDAYEAADATLNATYRELMDLLRRIDREAADGADRAGKLRDAQRAWIPFRDASCTLAGAAAYGGSLAPVLELSCMVDVTERRTRALREIQGDFGPQ